MHRDLFDKSLIQRYDTTTPRYTSYPTVPHFYPMDDRKFRRWSNALSETGPLSIYVHVPFCSTVCYYCACTKIITKNRKHSIPYLEKLCEESRLLADCVGRDRTVIQMHWGGGTPTFLGQTQMSTLTRTLRHHFRFADDDDCECSIEIDPREVDEKDIRFMRSLGFNRLSLGVQDLDPAVQLAVNRVQPTDKTRAILRAARQYEFASVSLDLIYGLPLQTSKSFGKTLDEVIRLGPDRLSVFNYAHLPQRFKVQRQIDPAQLPSAEEKLMLLGMAIDKLCDAGYVYIGMDHFAKHDDSLARAQREGSLQRNFQGYSTHGQCDLVGLGMSSISCIGGNYSQNYSTLDEYMGHLDKGLLPVARGCKPDKDDRIRRAVINELMCHFRLAMKSIERHFDISFNNYFKNELRELETMQTDGLLQVDDKNIVIADRGRLLVRNICAVFDHYLNHDLGVQYSKAI